MHTTWFGLVLWVGRGGRAPRCFLFCFACLVPSLGPGLDDTDFTVVPAVAQFREVLPEIETGRVESAQAEIKRIGTIEEVGIVQVERVGIVLLLLLLLLRGLCGCRDGRSGIGGSRGRCGRIAALLRWRRGRALGSSGSSGRLGRGGRCRRWRGGETMSRRRVASIGIGHVDDGGAR